jgi:hypothetical protein
MTYEYAYRCRYYVEVALGVFVVATVISMVVAVALLLIRLS